MHICDFCTNARVIEVPPFDTMGAIDILKRTRLDAADSLLTDAIGNVSTPVLLLVLFDSFRY